jgi:hypothetical protein
MARPTPNTEVTIPGAPVSLPLDALSATIAMEIAAGLATPESVCARYGITDAQWKVLKKNATFRAMLKDALERLSGDMNAGSRIKLKADVLLEDNLSVLDQVANDKDAQSMARIKAVEVIAGLAGRGPASQKNVEGAGGNSFSLNIVIGDREVKIESEKPALEHEG